MPSENLALNIEHVPQHVAVIMDGNGRWAKARGYPRAFGHIRGAARIKPLVLEANRLGVKVLTLFAFSTENWKRPEAELKVLWKLLIKFLEKEEEDLHRNGVRLCVIGEKDRLPANVLKVLDPALERLSRNTGIILNFAISYGSRLEIVEATKLIAEEVARGALAPSEINEALINEYLWTRFLGELSNVDLMIRTSGEQRISNYLLWQSAYAEFIFFDKNWPDFKTEDLREAFSEYGKRERRFGGLAGVGNHTVKGNA